MKNYVNAKRLSVFLLCMLAVIALSAFAAFINSDAENTNTNSSITSYKAEKTYIVREYKDVICVFEENMDIPVKTTDVKVSAFPKADIELLKKGIKVTGERELKRVLADYCS